MEQRLSGSRYTSPTGAQGATDREVLLRVLQWSRCACCQGACHSRVCPCVACVEAASLARWSQAEATVWAYSVSWVSVD